MSERARESVGTSERARHDTTRNHGRMRLGLVAAAVLLVSGAGALWTVRYADTRPSAAPPALPLGAKSPAPSVERVEAAPSPTVAPIAPAAAALPAPTEPPAPDAGIAREEPPHAPVATPSAAPAARRRRARDAPDEHAVPPPAGSSTSPDEPTTRSQREKVGRSGASVSDEDF